jgi:5'-3' exonuclease
MPAFNPRAGFLHAVKGLARRAWMSQQVARSNAARASAHLVRERREVEDVLGYLDDHAQDAPGSPRPPDRRASL